MTRVGVLRDTAIPSVTGLFGAILAVAPSFGVEASPVGLHDAGEIERGLTTFGRESNGGLIVTPSSLAIVHRELIVTLVAQLRLPAIYPLRYFVTDDGLISDGPDVVDQYPRAAGYVDRILKGEKPADLPVQQSTKFELAINLRPLRLFASQCLQCCSRPPTQCSSDEKKPNGANVLGFSKGCRSFPKPVDLNSGSSSRKEDDSVTATIDRPFF
jgi:hypothetical protein